MAILIIFSCLLCMVAGLVLLMSYELRLKLSEISHALLPSSKRQLSRIKAFTQHMNHAASAEHTQQYWYLQQWWILIAGLCLFSAILFISVSRSINPNQIEANYLKDADPQIYSLLNGELLTPPPSVDDHLVNEAITQAMQLQSTRPLQKTQFGITTNSLDIEAIGDMNSQLNTQMVDRKWSRMNPRYKQRLLMVFKIMKEKYDYEMVLLEGYRNPQRQNMLSANTHTTHARAFQSYHQFGLAADIAFIHEGKVVISERDPWAMRGYQLYGEVAESVGLVWGGHWKSIKDFGHTEYRIPNLKKTAEMAIKLTTEGQLNISTH